MRRSWRASSGEARNARGWRSNTDMKRSLWFESGLVLGGGGFGGCGGELAGIQYWQGRAADGDCEFRAAVSSDGNFGAAKCEAGGDVAIRDLKQSVDRA